MPQRKPRWILKRTTSLPKYLTSRRIRLVLTQKEIGERIKKSRSFICRIERGQRRRECLRGSILYDLAKAYDVPIEKVLKKAHWPQLLLMGTNEEQKQRIINYMKDTL